MDNPYHMFSGNDISRTIPLDYSATISDDPLCHSDEVYLYIHGKDGEVLHEYKYLKDESGQFKLVDKQEEI